MNRDRHNVDEIGRGYTRTVPGGAWANPLVARTLETVWESQRQEQRVVDEQEQRRLLTEAQREQIRALGTAPTTTDRKELQRSLLEEVKTKVLGDPARAARARLLYPDTVIIGSLHRQGTKTACVGSFTANRIVSLRHDWKTVCQAPGTTLAGGVAHSGSRCQPTGRCGINSVPAEWWVHRGRASHDWGSLAHSHDSTTQEDRGGSPPGYVAMLQATRILGLSRQTIMQRVKRGELAVAHTRRGKQKGLRIRILDNQPPLFDAPKAAKV